jgi:hypothetical protein
VVLDGATTTEPLTGTVPMPLLMEADVAPVEVHVRVEEPPTVNVAGEAIIFTVGLAAWTWDDMNSVTIKIMKTEVLFSCTDASLPITR